MIASCGFLVNELRQCSKEGVTMADSEETLGVDLRTRVKKLGAKEKSEEKKVQGEVLDYQEEQGLPKDLHEGGCQDVVTSEYGASKNVESARSSYGSYRKITIEGADDRSSGQTKTQSRCPCSWKHMASKWRKNFPPWPLSTGQKEGSRMENGIMNNEKLG